MESLDKEETRISVSPERIDAFLKEQDARRPTLREATLRRDEESVREPGGPEVALTWSSEGAVTLLGRQDARFNWDDLGTHEPGTYFMRFPRGDYRDIAIKGDAGVKVQWRT